MKIEQVTNNEDFMQTQHIVIMFTDGMMTILYLVVTTETVKVYLVRLLN